MRRLALIVLGVVGLPVSALAQTVVIALSSDSVQISSNFTGASITVFGALEDANLDPSLPLDIAVVLQGPPESTIVRRKDRLLGLWINRAQTEFAAIPAFYAVQSTRPLAEILGDVSLNATPIGLEAVATTAAAGSIAEMEFAEAVVRLRQADGVYYENAGTVERPGATVFRTAFDLPADVPIGAYRVAVYVFQANELIAARSVPMEVIKTGAEQFIYDASRNSPWLYALAIVLIAVAAGWLGGVIFRRD